MSLGWISSTFEAVGELITGHASHDSSEREGKGGAEKKSSNNNNDKENDDDQNWDLSPEEEYRLVIERLKAWYDTPKDDEGKLIQDEFLARMEAVFDKSFVRYSEGDTDADYDAFVQEAISLCKAINFDFKLFRYKQIEPGVFNSYVRYSTRDSDVIVTGKFYHKRAKLYKSEVVRILKPKVAGQITATKELLTNSFTAQQLARRVVELPSVSNSLLLAPQGGMLPAEERYEMLKLKMRYRMTNAFLAPLRRHDQIQIYQEGGDKPYVGGAEFRYTKRMMGRYESLLLSCSDKGQSYAFCEKNGDNGFTIFGTRPVVSGDHAHAEPQMKECGGEGEGQSNIVAFYPWFRVQLLGSKRDKETFGIVLLSVDVSQCQSDPVEQRPYGVVSGRLDSDKTVADFEPLLKIVPKNQGPSKKRTYVVCDYYHDKDRLFVVRADRKPPQDGKEVDVDVAPGVDPAMALCVAGCMEELTR